MAGTTREKRGSAPLKMGLVTSLLLIFMGFFGAFCWALAVPAKTVRMGLFAEPWVVLACAIGGFVSGFLGGASMWRRAWLNGVAVGAPLLLLLWGFWRGGPTAGEAGFCLLALPLSSSLGALLGANLSVKRGGVKSAARRLRVADR